MANVVLHRVFDFLKKYPPFSFIDEKDLLEISQQVTIKYFPPGQHIFYAGNHPENEFYVVHEGAIHLYTTLENEELLVDECDEGDIFGLRPLLAGSIYNLSAKTEEDSLIYAINVSDIKPLMEKYPRISLFFASSFAAGVRNLDAGNKGQLLINTQLLPTSTSPLTEIISVDHIKKPVTCSPDTSIAEAARIMTNKQVGSIIIVDENQLPIGILTDKDLRIKVVAQYYSRKNPVVQIMSKPVICIAPQTSIADVQITMVKNKINHLCITEDGTKNSMLKGVISEHDIVIQQANNPGMLIREAKKANHINKLIRIREKADHLLEKYLMQEVSISFITDIMSEINDAITARIIQLRLKEHPEINKEDFCWIAIGSAGRQEQLIKTDQDNGLIYRNGITDKNIFLQLAQSVNDDLNKIGFAYCPANMMASNPDWCLSLSEWKDKFDQWIYNPGKDELLLCTIFFDYRAIYGHLDFASEITSHLFTSIGKQDVFLHLLAKNALQNPPPLSFFRNFIVEKDGEHKDDFDIKTRAMMPLTDAARLLILDHQISSINNTYLRFEKLKEVEPQNEETYELAADAYNMLMRIRALSGIKNKDSGRYIDIASLDKMERMLLRNCFQPIRDLQSLIKVRFRL